MLTRIFVPYSIFDNIVFFLSLFMIVIYFLFFTLLCKHTFFFDSYPLLLLRVTLVLMA